ncbi:hypothetical protein [Streptomyces bacillaris]|uniref:hypothetical protein n=1 Tax=Streptomyces bacillaris TaxID=68179 RepID=UPI003F4A6631
MPGRRPARRLRAGSWCFGASRKARLSIEPGPHLTQESYSGVQLLALALEERDQLYGQVAGMWRLQMHGLARPTVLGRLRLERPPQT